MSTDTEQPVTFRVKGYLNIDVVVDVEFTTTSDDSDDDRENEFARLATEATVKRLNFDDAGVEYVVRTASFEDAD